MVRIIIADDTRLFREGLAHILEREKSISVVGTEGHSDGILMLVQNLRPEVVLLHMATAQSLTMIRAIAHAAPEVRVIALGVPESEGEILACVEAGAAGYLLRDASLIDLLATVRSVVRGETLCSPRIAATLLRRVASLAADRQPWKSQARLTPREREIVQFIDQGLSNKEIAQRLAIEVLTVKNHVHNILEKLRVRRRGEAAAQVREALPATRIALVSDFHAVEPTEKEE